MKKRKIITLSLLVSILQFFPSITLYAHSDILDVEYDVCIPKEYVNINNVGDGIDEKWYELCGPNGVRHIPDTLSTIKYYLSNTNLDKDLTWEDIVSPSSFVNHRKNLIKNGIEKWNSVYFYTYGSDNNLIKNKIVNIIEGSESDYNIIIYPEGNNISYAGSAVPIGSSCFYENINGTIHRHFDKWQIQIKVNHTPERTTTHEIGHVLGLSDLDVYCDFGNTEDHHEELLMGYGSPRMKDITYRDLAGVAITRGFHTDSDHKWMYDATSSSAGNYKLICSICNGVKHISNLSNYEYVIFGYCNENHDLTYNNMMVVGSYGNKDYYKCKYCRYVVSMDSLSIQDYEKVNYGHSFYHRVDNQVSGLEYSFLEEHSYSGNVWVNLTNHKENCECGDYNLLPHVVIEGSYDNGALLATCYLCGGEAQIGFEVWPNNYQRKTSANGSYILPNGVIILVEEDIYEYINGTLVFNDNSTYYDKL